jgi:hypothetical protein
MDAIQSKEKKTFKSLPNTPIKKAAIVETMENSPRIATILYDKCVCISGQTKKKLDVALDIMEGMKLHIDEIKSAFFLLKQGLL